MPFDSFDGRFSSVFVGALPLINENLSPPGEGALEEEWAFLATGE
jgi:hypothetical protein